MIVRNERDDLPSCLDSVRGLADETVVVDTGSTDGTQEIARRRGAVVIETSWADDFSAARNVGLDRARGAWILVLDADESLPEASAAGIRELIRREPGEAFSLVTRSTDLSTGQHTRGEIVRLFPNRPGIRFGFPIHESVNRSLILEGIPIRPTGIEIAHSGYATSRELEAKAARNRRIIEAALAGNPPLELELHLRYYRASGFYDDGEYARAAVEYEACLERIGSSDGKLAGIARLRAAECRFISGDPGRALALLPDAGDGAMHPAALCLRAQIESSRGATDAARMLCEELLRARDSAYTPPVALGVLKYKALAMLASDWAGRDRKDIAVEVLKLARGILRGERDGARPDMGDLYAGIVRGAGG
jgi:hypothetical protein